MTIFKKSAICFLLVLAFSLLTVAVAYSIKPLLLSTYTSTAPTIDGKFDPFEGEWPTNYALKISDQLDSTLFISNNNTSLFIMVDAASNPSLIDETEENDDHCTVYLHNNGNGTYKGLRVTVFGDGDKLCEYTNDTDTPLNWNPLASCPAGVNAVDGFGASPDTPTIQHRMYEFEIPLSVIGAMPGDTIDFASPYDQIDSLPFDYNSGSSRFNIWPLSSTTNDLNTWGLIQLGVSESIPSLNEWGMIIFAVLAGLGAIHYMKRQKTAKS